MYDKKKISRASIKLINQLPLKNYQNLKKLIYYHNNAYFIRNKPEITDEAFDKLVESLKFINTNVDTSYDFWSKHISNNNLNIIIHKEKMLSLNKFYNNNYYYKWEKKINCNIIAMPKIDGVACSLRYNNCGELKIAATRGDGKKGENIINNILKISNIPHILPKNISAEIRGEVYIKISKFNKKFSSKFANARNLAAGALRQKNSNISSYYELSFFPYDIRGIKANTEEDKFKLLRDLNFKILDIKLIKNQKNIDKTIKYYWDMRKKYDYETDGIVFKANNITEQIRLGETERYPRFSIAYKYQGESGQTNLIGINWSIGRTGVITPICVFSPIFISGVTVIKASAHNISVFEKLNFKKKSLLEVVRRGGVIPYVEKVLQSSGDNWKIIKNCPSCNQKTLIVKDFLYCSNKYKCLGVIKERIFYFCKIIEIKGFGKKIINVLVDKGIIKKLSDIYKLTFNDLLCLKFVGKNLANKLLKEIFQKKTIPLNIFITSLGFKDIGPNVARKLSNYFKSFFRIKYAKKKEIKNLYGIGESIASSFVMEIEKYNNDINTLLSQICLLEDNNLDDLYKDHIIYKKNLVFTGKMIRLNRKNAEKYVHRLGGKTSSSVTSKTDYLVISDSILLQKKSTKHRMADDFILAGIDIKIISEKEFVEIIEI